MSATHNQHQQFRDLLTQNKLDDAQSLWLELADEFAAQPDFLLLLVKEFADAGHPFVASDLASLLVPNLREAGRLHEWLFALKLQAAASPKDHALRNVITEAYTTIYGTDARLKTILNVAGLDRDVTLLPAAIAKADTLLALAPGSYCHQKSWGYGRVKTFDATLGRLLIAFPHNPDHALQLPYAAESLTPIGSEHLEARKLADLAGLQQLAANDSLALLRLALASHNHAVSAERLETILTPSVIATADWKKWWDGAKRLAKKDPHFEIPAKKNEPVVLRAAPVSQQDDLLDSFRDAPSLIQKTEIARQFLKIADEIADPELMLQELQDGLLASLRATKKELYQIRLEAAFALEDVRARQKTPAESAMPLIAEILDGVRNLPLLLEELGAATHKRAVAALKVSMPMRLLNDLNRFSSKTLDQTGDLIAEIAPVVERLVINKEASAELLCWICRNIADVAWLQPIHGPVLIQAIFNALEVASAKSARKLYDILFNNETLLVDLLADAPTDAIRDVARQLLASPAFEELDRRSLMARLVKAFPFVQEFLVTRTAKEQPLLVSWTSLRRRQAELEDLIQKQIPQNSKEIAAARSYGDLRENFEFKAAKETQKVLMRRRGDLELLLVRAQGTGFDDVKTDVVGIGTTVTVTDQVSGQPVTYHILGAWDSDTVRGIISYPAALAQALLNKRVGDVVEANSDTGKLEFRIERIEKVPAEILQSL
jgi:transcription elongation GreA/GreB family factor